MNPTKSLSRFAFRFAAALLLAGVSTAGAYYGGIGKNVDKGNACLIGYNGIDSTDVTVTGKKQFVYCTDCDPDCDLDGVTTANGECTFDIGVCINQSGVAGCDPPSALDKGSVKGKVKGVKGAEGKVVIDVSQLLDGSACSAFLPVTVPEDPKEKKGAAIKISASVKKNKAEDTPKRKNKQKLTYVCVPRPAGEDCPAPPTVFSFTTGLPVGNCGAVKTGGASGTLLKDLGCGGLNVGGGNSTVAEGPTPDNAETQLNIACTGSTCTATGRTAAETGSPTNCSDTGCPFGPYLPIANAGSSTCVRNTFSSPASGTLDISTGAFTGAFPLTSTVYLTANAVLPCPLCINGTPGTANSGTCQDATQWASGAGASPDAGLPCTPTNATGNSHDCDPPAVVQLTPFAVNLDPITTGTASKDGPSFCPSQANDGAFACNGTTTALCPNGALGMADYIEEVGALAGDLSSGPQPGTLASVFCIPDAGNFVINAAANLPGPGATSLPGTFELLP